MELPTWWPSVELLLGVGEATILLRNVIPKDFSVNSSEVCATLVKGEYIYIGAATTRALASSFMWFVGHTHRRTASGRTSWTSD